METSTLTKVQTNTNNLTYKYIRPCLRFFGKDFIMHFNRQVKLGFAIADKLLEDSPYFKDKNLLFIKLDTSSVRFSVFYDFIEYCRENYILFSTYNASSDISDQDQMVVVIKFPEDFDIAFENFKKGKYSKMFTREQINNLFSGDKFEFQRKVFNKDSELREKYLQNINDTYGTNIERFEDFKNYEDIELDKPFNPLLETF